MKKSPKIKKIKHIKNRKRIKEIMNQYEIEIWKAEVYAVLSGYSETELHRIGRTMQQMKNDGKMNRPSAFLAAAPDAICFNILAAD